MNVLVVDVGGTNVKILATGQKEPRRFPSGPTLTPEQMVAGVKKLAEDWKYDVISVGYPGVVQHGRIATEPHHLGKGWVDFDFQAAFGCPVKMINDAAMQALGSYRGGTMLFLGLGTGLGTALIADGTVVPMELGHLGLGKRTFDEDLGSEGSRGRAGRNGRGASKQSRCDQSPYSSSTTWSSAAGTPKG